MQFIIANQTRQGNFRLQVFNRGFHIATHVSVSKRYLRKVIRNYTDAMTDPSHAGHGHPTHVIWA
jgi:hypothetical protein